MADVDCSGSSMYSSVSSTPASAASASRSSRLCSGSRESCRLKPLPEPSGCLLQLVGAFGTSRAAADRLATGYGRSNGLRTDSGDVRVDGAAGDIEPDNNDLTLSFESAMVPWLM